MNAQRQTMVIQLQNTSFHVLMSTNKVVTDNQPFSTEQLSVNSPFVTNL